MLRVIATLGAPGRIKSRGRGGVESGHRVASVKLDIAVPAATRNYLQPTDEKPEAQRDNVTSPKSFSESVAGDRSNLGCTERWRLP